MLSPPIAANEQQRLQALRDLQLLDTPPEERFDRLTRLARALFDVPIALVSLVDQDRQWFKSCVGLDESETPRSVSFCGHAILEPDTFQVPDAHQDPRFADNPLVTGAPHIRFYVGAQLRTPAGDALGSLCLIDTRPRQLDGQQLQQLRDLADCVENELLQAELVQAMTELRQSQSFNHAILETAADGIITIDEQGVIQLVNPAACDIFDTPREGLVGKPVLALLPEADRPMAQAYLAQLQQRDRAASPMIRRVMTGQRSDGSCFPMELSLSALSLVGRQGFTGMVRDISEQQRLEQVKAQFIATVSHELRTPLTSIRGAVDLVLARSADLLPEKLHGMLQTASRNGERLTLLINDILDLEKLQSGGFDFVYAQQDLYQLAALAVQANQGYAERHQVELVLSAFSGSAPVWADEARLMQVFANLISNAIKFSPAQATVTVALRRLPGVFRLSVFDQGDGIPAAFRQRIFGRFEQVDSSDSRKKGGTGLGLSIAKTIIEKHQGVIDFDSEEGVGTEFFFELPAHDVDAADGDRN